MQQFGLVVSALVLGTLLVSSIIALARPAYAAIITKFKIDESATVKIAGTNHGIKLSLDGSFRAGEKTSTDAKGTLTIDNTNYSVTSSTVKVDASGKKISISSKLQARGSITTTILLPQPLDMTKSKTLTTQKGSIIAVVTGKVYNARTISSATIGLQTVESSISKITTFSVLGSSGDDEYTASFQLLDRNQSPTSADGKLGLVIKDGKDRILYQRETAVSKADFQAYQYTYTGTQFLAYSWTIPISEVASGFGYFGKAELTFIDSTGVSLKSTFDLVSIPKLTDEEVQKMNEEAFRKSAVTIDQTVESGPFSITVEKAGYFTVDSFGTDEKLYRVDLAITNIGPTAEYIPSDYVILDGRGNQYDKDYHGTIDFKNVYSGVTIKGYQTFEPISQGLAGVKLVITKNSYPNDYSWEFTLSPSTAKPATTSTSTTNSNQQNCDPAYPDVCIASPPPDLDCKDISYRNFRVLAPDPHRFDSDKDGIGCET